jgi:glutathione S-transferase
MLTLYHSRASVASAKVRLVLSEKRLAWEGHVLDLHQGDQHRPEYRAIHRGGVVPALVHDTHIVNESSVIMHYLDEVFPTPATLMPTDPFDRARVRLWMKSADERLHPACVTLTFALAFRRSLAGKTPHELEAYFRHVRDPELRDRQLLAVTRGLDASHVRPAAAFFNCMFGEMEEALSRSAFLAGESYSLADAAITPYVLRAQMLGMERFWAEGRPNLTRWFARVRARPSFDEAIISVMTDADRARLTVSTEETWPQIREILARTSGVHWSDR